MPTEKQLANLRPPWKPGEHVPGAGRPRKRPQSEANDERLREVLPEPMRVALNKMSIGGAPLRSELLKKGATWADAIALGLSKKALQGDSFAAKELRESVEGKSVQRFELGAPEDRGFSVSVSFEPLPEKLQKKLGGEVIDVTPEPELEDPKSEPEQQE
jgi:hypothetical protein